MRREVMRLVGVGLFASVAILSLILLVGIKVARAEGPPIQGRLEGVGTHFVLTDTLYLPITVDSSQPINLFLESIPDMVTMIVESASDATSADITISGLSTATTFHMYQDDYHNHVSFMTDDYGVYTYTQDLTVPHLVFIQPRESTKFIKDPPASNDSTVGCTSIGVWNSATKTCTLTTDVNETIQIDNSGITLDGAGHTVQGTSSGHGIAFANASLSGITVKNMTIKSFDYGVYLYKVTGVTVQNVNATNNLKVGIYVSHQGGASAMDNHTIVNNTVSSAVIEGIYLRGGSGNTVTGNTFSFNGIGVRLDTSAKNNTVYHNDILTNTIQASSNSGSGNIFNMAAPTGGNYWSNWNTPDSNHDGFVDSPYLFNGGVDNLPLANRINRADQTITFNALPGGTYGDFPFTVVATATSGLPVSYTATGNCSASGNTVTITGAGSCTITASQSGDANYNAAPDVSQSFSIGKATASLSLSSLTQTYDGSPKTASASTSPLGLSGVALTYNGSSTPPSSAGSYAVVASLTNPNYQAPDAAGTLVIGKANQTITFGTLTSRAAGDPPFTVSATATSGLLVSYAAAGNCTVSGNTVTITGAGSCLVIASQLGDANYNMAAPISQTFSIAKANQTIDFGPLGLKTFGDPPFTVSAIATSGLPVSFAAAGACSVSGNAVTITGAGSCTITASQAGDSNYNSATEISQTFSIGKTSQTITFNALSDRTYGDLPFTVSATASSGLAVSFDATGNCTVSGSTVSITGIGACTVFAKQSGDTNYNSAPDVSRTFNINSSPTSNLPPTAISAGGPYTVAVSQTVVLIGSATDPNSDPMTYNWDLNNDGIFDASGQTVTFSANNRTAPSDQIVVLQVCDNRSACAELVTTIIHFVPQDSSACVSSVPSAVGPHGDYSATTDECAACHRAHTAKGDTLLTVYSTATNRAPFCYSCHGSAMMGADTNVQDGIYGDARYDDSSLGLDTAPLKGGGFDKAKMSTKITDTAILTTTTSGHTVDGTPGTLWGSGDITSTGFAGRTGFQLTCTNCHDPHGSGNYRLLKKVPVNSGVVTDIVVPEPAARYYTVDGSMGVYNYFGVSYCNARELSNWCAACHTRDYSASPNSGHVDSGDPTFAYRHNSDGTLASCLTCHVAHGTSAKMGAYSANVLWPDGTKPTGQSRSVNLRLDGRGVCQSCHQK